MDLSRKLAAGAKDGDISGATDKSAHQTPSPERRPNRIEYTHTPAVEIPAAVLERNRIAVVANNGTAADAFRLLRTQVLMEMRRNGWQTLAVTSPNQGAGKSTVSLNLAISFGMEVDLTALLIDADLRDPYLRNMLELAPGPGLGDYLVGKARLEDLLIHPNIGNLVLLPGGAPVQNTAELMGSPMMAEMVGELRSRYPNRLIVFDVPANLSGADTMALSSYIDATILLVEENRTTPDEIERACDLLRHVNLLGIVLNKSRELPDPGPSRRRRPGFFSRYFGSRSKSARFAAGTNGNTGTAMPGPPSNHRNELPQRGDSTTTVPGGLSDSSRERDPTPLAPAPRMSKQTDETPVLPDEADFKAGRTKGFTALVRPPSPIPLEERAQGDPKGKRSRHGVRLAARFAWIFLALALVFGLTGIYLAKTGRFDAIEFLRSWLVSTPSHETVVPQNDPQAVGLVGRKRSDWVDLSSKLDREHPTQRDSTSSRSEPRQLPDEQGQDIGRAVQDGGSIVELGSEAQPKEAFIGTNLPNAPRSVSIPVVTNGETGPYMNPVMETDESADGPQLAATTESAAEFDDTTKFTRPPLEIKSIVRPGDEGKGGELNVESSSVAEPGDEAEMPELAGEPSWATKPDKPLANLSRPVQTATATGLETAIDTPVATAEMETGAGPTEVMEDPVFSVETETAAGSEKAADADPAASDPLPAHTDVESDTTTIAARIDAPSAETAVSAVHDDREENLRLTPPASGSHHGTVPVIAGVDLPGLGDVPQSGSEPQASKPEILAPAEPPRPLHSATKTPPQLDLDLLLARGNQLLALGDVASARLFYRLAATKGSAEGAVAMGSTYDPVNLERAGIAGVRPSPAEAIKWYLQAIDMGHQGAGAQLRELTNSLERATTSGTGDAQPNLENTRN